MRKTNSEKLVISGAPAIGEGNIVDSKALIAVLAKAGMPGIGLYPNGPFVLMGRMFHAGMSMSTKKTMDYARISEVKRSSWMVRPLKWELRRAIRKTFRNHPGALCFITSQDMMAEESAGSIGTLPTILVSSDVYGKFSAHSRPSQRQEKIIHVVWNREAYDVYRSRLDFQHLHLIKPVDPVEAFTPMERSDLPFQEALSESNVCFMKLSGSGGDPGLINSAIVSLWKRNRIKSIVFPGTEKTQKRLIPSVGDTVRIEASLDPSVFYNQAREMISHEHMLLTFPSEQVKHLAVLSQNNIFPRVAWLPPRGYHEVLNLAWAVNKGFSGTICIPMQYQAQLKGRLMSEGINPSDIEMIHLERLSAEHFKPSPPWRCDPEAAPLEKIIDKITDIR